MLLQSRVVEALQTQTPSKQTMSNLTLLSQPDAPIAIHNRDLRNTSRTASAPRCDIDQHIIAKMYECVNAAELFASRLRKINAGYMRVSSEARKELR
jgi:hypothetical protein